MSAKIIVPEFSRLLTVEKIPLAGAEVRLDANEDERAQLSKRFHLLEIITLSAFLRAHEAKDRQGVIVTGRSTAEVVQQCVVTLEPLRSHLEFEIDVLFLEAVAEAEDGTLQLEPESEDIELIYNGVIDLGELVAQHLGLALDPYPRKAGTDYIEIKIGEDDLPPNPFAKLVDWAKKPPKS